jgi:hypothetical protein
MTLQRLVENITDWLKNKTTGVITIILHEGGIRKVRIEQDVK